MSRIGEACCEFISDRKEGNFINGKWSIVLVININLQMLKQL